MTLTSGLTAQLQSLAFSGDVKQCKGYRLTSIKSIKHSIIGQLELVKPSANAYGRDIEALVLHVDFRGANELRVHIVDAEELQYQLPDDLRFDVEPETPSSSTQLQFNHRADPFAFWITRVTGEVIFDTRPENIPVHPESLMVDGFPVRDSSLPAYPLVFSDQYLQLASALPAETNIYGLGDVMATSGFRRNNHGTVQSFWNSDPAGNPTDRNLYGTHAFYLESRSVPEGHNRSHGVYLRNTHGTDVILRTGVIEYRCLGGTLDLTFLAGPTPHSVVRQYSQVVGRPVQMPYWSFGFHLCSIGHKTLDMTQEVVEKMAQAGVPLEVMWNDFYYMDRKRNFSVSVDFPPAKFKEFTDRLHANGQYYVPLLDAGMYKPASGDDHYPQYTSGNDAGVFLKDDQGEEYEGYVWCGKTVWPDWTHPQTAKWWSDCIIDFRRLVNFDGLWLDMNEPANLPVSSDKWLSTKNIVEINGRRFVDLGQNIWDYPPYAIHNGWKSLSDLTVPASAKLADGWRHYHQHNLYPMQEAVLTTAALEKMDAGKRHFLMSRGTFAGQGTLTAHWLGDNYSTWDSLRKTIQGVLQHQLFQMPMVGADVGGFGGDATEELVHRWMQVGAFLPFYRNHNASAPQEPYLWPAVVEASKTAIDIRYRLLPYWESLFAQANADGSSPIRPLFFEFDDADLFNVDLQFMIGSGLLVSACMEQGETTVTGRFPTKAIWRDWYSHQVLANCSDGKLTIPAPLGHIPVHIRGGAIILLHTESRYTLKETRTLPYELLVSLDDNQRAEASFVIDDGLNIKSETTKIICAAGEGILGIKAVGSLKVQPLDRVVILGLAQKPSSCTVGGKAIEFDYDDAIGKLKLSELALPLSSSISIQWK